MSDDSYVHEPGAGRTSADSSDADSDDAGPERREEYPRNTPSETDAEFDWRGWLLVGAVVLAFLVVPGMLYVLPTVQEAVASLGLGLKHTYLVLPLIPAFLLGIIAVWSAVRSRAR